MVTEKRLTNNNNIRSDSAICSIRIQLKVKAAFLLEHSSEAGSRNLADLEGRRRRDSDGFRGDHGRRGCRCGCR